MAELYSIHAASSLSLEKSRLSKLPILLLNTHSSCNCRCVMCDIWKRKDGLELHAIELERHRESILQLGVKHVIMTGGEPLLNRELGAICQFFRDMQIRTTLLTTGLLLSKKAASVADSFDDIIISIDGPQAVHDRIRRVSGAFAAIEKGVAAVRRLQPKISISCRTTVQKLNHVHLLSTVHAAKALELSCISFLPVDLVSEAFNREAAWTHEHKSEVALNREELFLLECEIERVISECQKEIDTGFIAEGNAKLRRMAHRFREHLDPTLQPTAPLCNAPWVSAVIDVDGSVRPCFFHAPVANWNHLTLVESINSTAALTFRNNLQVTQNATCKRCVCSLNYRN